MLVGDVALFTPIAGTEKRGHAGDDAVVAVCQVQVQHFGTVGVALPKQAVKGALAVHFQLKKYACTVGETLLG